LIDHTDRVKMLQDLITTTYSSFQFEFYTTSIYNLFSIIRLISHTLQRFLPISKELNHILKDYSQQLHFQQSFLFDNKSIIISDYCSIPNDKSDLSENTIAIINAHMRIYKQFDEQQIKTPYITNSTPLFEIKCFQFRLYPDSVSQKEIDREIKKNNYKFNNYYLTLFYDQNANTTIDDIESIEKKLLPALRKKLLHYFDQNRNERG
jgi:hypothetical protein